LFINYTRTGIVMASGLLQAKVLGRVYLDHPPPLYKEVYMVNLCSKCRQADKTCPIYSPSEEVYKCIEWKPVVDILMGDFIKLSTQNVQ